MAYSAVPTVVTGQVWTASNHNTYIRDNFAAGVPDLFTTAGDIVYATGADAAARLALVTNGVLIGGAAAPAWLTGGAIGKLLRFGTAPAWATIAEALGVAWDSDLTQRSGIVGTSYAAVTESPVVTVTPRASGEILVLGALRMRNNTTGEFVETTLHDGTGTRESEVIATHSAQVGSNNRDSHPLIGVLTGFTPNASVSLEMQHKVTGGSGDVSSRFLLAMALG